MAQPPPVTGGDVPFWSRGDWWQGQPDGSLRRWSSFQEDWFDVEPAIAEKVNRSAAERPRRDQRKRWIHHRLPVIVVTVGVWLNLALFFASNLGEITPGVLILVIGQSVALGFVVNWLLPRV